MKKPRLLTGTPLTDALDEVTRQILHKMYPHPICFVCGRVAPWFHPQKNKYGIQVGHFISRRVHPLRWDFKNIEPQCSSCNKNHQWNTLPFTARMVATYGEERIAYLQKKYHGYKNVKMTTVEKRLLLAELQLLLDSYQSK
jgi:hypothetical protein